MSKLDEIQKAVKEYEGYLKEWDKWNHDNSTMGGRNAHEDLMCATLNDESYEYLKVLLPIVEAAAALDYKWLQRAQHEMSYTDEDVEPLNRLEAAVGAFKALEAEEGSA